ncbi:MAG: glycosyltransferase family 1 protein [Clostridia bacterium]|nr:glycosyltransferase family 1 protein [Clostridia bacterium]
MRIAYFTDTYYPEINGVTNTLLCLHKYLDDNNIEHIFFTPQYSEEKSGAYIMRFKGLKIPFYPNSRLALPYHTVVKKKIQEFQLDIIHIVTEFTIGNEGIRIAREMNIPVVTSYHTNIEQYLEYFHVKLLEKPVKAYFHKFHSNAEITFCPSMQTLLHLKTQGYYNLDIWSRGVDNTLYSPLKRKNRWRKQFGTDKFICLYVGRLSYEKGLDVYIEAIKKINKNYGCEIVFVFAGDGPYRNTLESFEADNVKLTGFIRGEMLAELYADSDLFVFPSGTETFGNVLLEAMASGIPAICTNSGGVTDFAVNNKNTIMVPFRDSNALADAIVRIKENSLLQEKIAAGGLKTARERSWNLIMNGLINSYAQILEQYAEKRA